MYMLSPAAIPPHGFSSTTTFASFGCWSFSLHDFFDFIGVLRVEL
jgi:hypothetical protein